MVNSSNVVPADIAFLGYTFIWSLSRNIAGKGCTVPPRKAYESFSTIYQDFEVHLVDSNGEDYHVHRLVEDPPTVCALENGSTASRAYPHDVFEDCIR